MNEQYMSIVKKYGLAKSTVSKAARHCSGVDSDTRQMILDELKARNLVTVKKADIYCILPDIPKYFWHEVRRGVAEGLSGRYSMKLNILTRSHDEATVLTYLDEAAEAKPSVLIISAFITEKIRAKLSEMIDDTFILSLSEYCDLTNAFYIGADPYNDGYSFGCACRSRFRIGRAAVLCRDNDRNSLLRSRGFMDALIESNASIEFIKVPLSEEAWQQKYSPSRLAKLLSPLRGNVDCVYSSTGEPSLPLAVKKAGFDPSVLILAHDTFSSADPALPDEEFSAVVNQDVYSQGRAAIAAAEHFVRTQSFPQSKFTFIPSVVRQNIT